MRDEEDKSPIQKKAFEILKLAHHLVESLPERAPNADKNEDDESLFERMQYGGEHAQRAWEDHQQWIMECAHTLPSKIAGAHGADLYDIYYEHAALIRRACRELVLNMRGLESCGYEETQYTDLIRQAVEVEFKPLFREWVATFKDAEHIPDSWGLFNPPGVKWDDEWE